MLCVCVCVWVSQQDNGWWKSGRCTVKEEAWWGGPWWHSSDGRALLGDVVCTSMCVCVCEAEKHPKISKTSQSLLSFPFVLPSYIAISALWLGYEGYWGCRFCGGVNATFWFRSRICSGAFAALWCWWSYLVVWQQWCFLPWQADGRGVMACWWPLQSFGLLVVAQDASWPCVSCHIFMCRVSSCMLCVSCIEFWVLVIMFLMFLCFWVPCFLQNGLWCFVFLFWSSMLYFLLFSLWESSLIPLLKKKLVTPLQEMFRFVVVSNSHKINSGSFENYHSYRQELYCGDFVKSPWQLPQNSQPICSGF